MQAVLQQASQRNSLHVVREFTNDATMAIALKILDDHQWRPFVGCAPTRFAQTRENKWACPSILPISSYIKIE